MAVEGGVTHLWCPSTGMPGRDHGFGSVSSHQPGLTFLEFEGDRVSFAVVPSGVGVPEFTRLRSNYGAFRNWPPLSEPPSQPS